MAKALKDEIFGNQKAKEAFLDALNSDPKNEHTMDSLRDFLQKTLNLKINKISLLSIYNEFRPLQQTSQTIREQIKEDLKKD